MPHYLILRFYSTRKNNNTTFPFYFTAAVWVNILLPFVKPLRARIENFQAPVSVTQFLRSAFSQADGMTEAVEQ